MAQKRTDRPTPVQKPPNRVTGTLGKAPSVSHTRTVAPTPKRGG